MHAATLHGPRDVTVADNVARAGHDASSPLCAKQKPLCTRQNRAGRLPSRAWGVGARPVPEGLDPAPLVDFCNQNSPRAQPPISRSPAGASKVALLRAVRVEPPRRLSGRSPCGPALRARLRNRSLAGSACSPRRARASRASRPASRSLGPSGLPGDTNRAFTGQGPSVLTDDASRAGTPKGAHSKSFAPTRSTRAPPVVGPRQRRLESPAVPGARPACATCGTNASAIPPRRPSLRRARRPSCSTLPQPRSRLRVRVAVACTALLDRMEPKPLPGRDEEPRAASPVPPRRGSGIRRTRGAFHR